MLMFFPHVYIILFMTLGKSACKVNGKESKLRLDASLAFIVLFCFKHSYLACSHVFIIHNTPTVTGRKKTDIPRWYGFSNVGPKGTLKLISQSYFRLHCAS